jgi:crotonobetainyl-CoA:carnitine CoA-transferase CaiB-like acyl-CoA transferase
VRDERLPLAGARVLEAATVAAGPYAGHILHGLGAELVKVEHPAGGDPLRRWAIPGQEPGPVFGAFNGGKKSIALDLSDPRGVDTVLRLLPRFDVFLHTGRPGTLERRGLGGQACLMANPRLVYVSMTGFGATGPLAQRPALDNVVQSIMGLVAPQMAGGGVPPGSPAMCDMASGLMTAAGAMVGLLGRARSGRGAIIETSMLESMTAVLADSLVRASLTGAQTETPPRDSLMFQLKASDGRFVSLHLATLDKFWNNLVHVLDDTELAGDRRFDTYAGRIGNYDELNELLGRRFEKRSSSEWEAILSRADVPFATVLSTYEATLHPQVEHLELVARATDGTVAALRGPWRIDGERPRREANAPALGAHTRHVLTEVADEAEIEELLSSGVAAAGAPAHVPET